MPPTAMRDMNPSEIESLLGNSGVCVLALAEAGDAYAIPLFYGRDQEAFYFHSRPGMKDDFIHSTKQACLLVSRVSTPDSWQSVQVFGRLERLTGEKAHAATKVLANVPFPPEWALSLEQDPRRTERGTVVWRLVVARMFGRKSQPAKDDPAVA